MLPFDYGDDQDPLIVISIIPDLAQIFETKVRSPYKVVFEVCKLSELLHQNPQSTKLDYSVINRHLDDQHISPPSLATDPFKDKWKNTIFAYN